MIVITPGKPSGDFTRNPEKTVAPRPFPNSSSGADCTYQSTNPRLLFRGYVDSPSAATDLFARLKSFFSQGSTSVGGLGDDAGHGLHVRKGVRSPTRCVVGNSEVIRWNANRYIGPPCSEFFHCSLLGSRSLCSSFPRLHCPPADFSLPIRIF